jgi:hypothetical protein
MIDELHQRRSARAADQRTSERQRSADALRQLADLLDTHEVIPDPGFLPLLFDRATEEQVIGMVGLGLPWRLGSYASRADAALILELAGGRVVVKIPVPTVEADVGPPVQTTGAVAEALQLIRTRNADGAA